MLNKQNSRRNFLKGLSSASVGGLIASHPLLAAGVDSSLTAKISQIVLKNYPVAKPYPGVVKAFAESLQQDQTQQLESPLFVMRSSESELASYVTVQFSLSTNVIELSAGKAEKLVLL